MSSMGPREGGCQCGTVRYVAAELDDHMHACHCSICRRISGLATLSVTVPFAAMQIRGEEHVVVYTSSDWATRAFCGRCGSGLWYRLNGEDADFILSAGTLDDLSGLTLTQEIHVEMKPQGYAFAGDHPRLTGAEFEATLTMQAKE
jgi:hypothetical protein